MAGTRSYQRVGLAVALFLGLALVVPAVGQYSTVADIVTKNPQFSTLKAAVDAAGLTSTISDPNFVGTVFAPSNAAFKRALAALKLKPAQLLANKELLTKILGYHVIAGQALDTFSIVRGGAVDGIGGPFTTLESSPLYTFVNGLAPALPYRGFVLGLQNGANVTDFDTKAGKATVFPIDNVLLPPDRHDSIAAAVKANPDLSILLQAVTKAGLAGALSAPFNATVFAPTNTAFANLAKYMNVTADQLLENPDLTSILQYHVIPGPALTSYDLNAWTFPSVATLLGQEVEVAQGPGGVWVKGAGNMSPSLVTKGNILVPSSDSPTAAIHIIDQVLLPDQVGLTIVPNPTDPNVIDRIDVKPGETITIGK